MKTVLVATTNTIKLNVIETLFPKSDYTITYIDCDNISLPRQPYRSTYQCARSRLDYIKNSTKSYDYYISIENGIEVRDDYKFIYVDICAVIIECNGLIASSSGLIKFYIPSYIVSKCKQYTQDYIHRGFSKTVGELLYEENSDVDPLNWMLYYHKKNKSAQITSSIMGALAILDSKKIIISKLYNKYPDDSIIEERDQKIIADIICCQYQYTNKTKLMLHSSCDYMKSSFIEIANKFGLIINDNIDNVLSTGNDTILVADNYQVDGVMIRSNIGVPLLINFKCE